MPFDLETWKAKLNERLQGWRPRMRKTGVASIYAFLSAAALWPVVEAARAGDWGALTALGSLLAGVGTNLVANQIQGWKDEADAARQLSETLPEHPELRLELDEVLEKLDALQTAEQQLPEAERPEFARQVSQELENLGSRLTITIFSTQHGGIAYGVGATAGGAQSAIVTGSVGGDFVGPGGTLIKAPDQRQIKADEQADAKRRYLQRFYQRCCYLPLAAMGAEESTGDEITLDKVYIALDTTTPVKLTEEEIKQRKEDDRFSARGEQDTRPLSALEAALAAARLVLLGDPGSGKTTFARNLLAWQAAANLGARTPPDGIPPQLVPLLILLRDLAPRLAGLDLQVLSDDNKHQALTRLVREQIVEDLEALEAQAYAEGLLDALREGRVFLVLDGLDEVPAGLRAQIRLVVGSLLKEYRLQRVLITCRVRSYTGQTVFPDFHSHTLAPFDPEQVRSFAKAWYNAQHKLGRVDARQAQEKTKDLAEAALGEDLRKLSSNPMMLTSMAIIHQKEIGLPRERVRLYNLTVDVLLWRWQKHKAGEKGMAPSAALNDFLMEDVKLRRVVERLAYEAQSSDQGEDEAADLPRGQALTLLEDPQYLASAELASEFLDYIDQRAGLLVGRGGEADQPTSYSFPHRTFQEYLAGCYIVGLRDAGRELFRRASQGDDWSLAAQLGAEELFFNRHNPILLLDLAYGLNCEPQDDQRQRAVLWSANMTAVLGQETIQRDVGNPDGGAQYLGRLKPRLVTLLGGSLSPPERAEAGRDLALLGDPRLEVTTLEGMAFCFVPGGPFRMGSEERGPWLDERPEHQVDLQPYWISGYPITNAQFEVFTQAGGYAAGEWWREARRDGLWEAGRIQRQVWTGTKYESEWGEAPYDYGRPFNLANHPVVGVTWYEALAFCRYLRAICQQQSWLPDGWQVSLPSEAEWEKAARGGLEAPARPIPGTLSSGLIVPRAIDLPPNPLQARKYPWGESFDSENANSAESGIRSTSAVGCFPDGTSPYGLQDMSGNVWEWTRSLQGDYPYPASGKSRNKRENLEASQQEGRVRRGGAFLSVSGRVRCACRYGGSPDLGDGYLGFRVVVSPFDSGL